MSGQPFFIPSLVILLLSLPLIFGWIPRQGIYGVRTPRTLSDDALWYPANRFGGCVFLAASLIYLAVAWGLPCLAPCGTVFSQWLVHLAAFALPLAVALALTGLYAARL